MIPRHNENSPTITHGDRVGLKVGDNVLLKVNNAERSMRLIKSSNKTSNDIILTVKR